MTRGRGNGASRIGQDRGLVEWAHEGMDIEHAVLDERRDNLDNHTTKVFRHQLQQVLWRWERERRDGVAWRKASKSSSRLHCSYGHLLARVEAFDRLALLVVTRRTLGDGVGLCGLQRCLEMSSIKQPFFLKRERLKSMKEPGLDNRHRDKNGEISRKHGNPNRRRLIL